MRPATWTTGLLSAFLLSNPALVNGAPTKDSTGVRHVPKSAGWNDSPSKTPDQVDVVIVGGGFSGLSSAYMLEKAGLKTVVLEARDSLGGRSRSHRLDNGPGLVELGATWINNKTQPAVFALTEEFGLETIEQYDDGDSVREGIDETIVKEGSDDLQDVCCSQISSKQLSFHHADYSLVRRSPCS